MKSMTGYGRGEANDEHRKVTVELKAVNNRYLEINSRFPRALSFLDDCVKKQIQDIIKRGTIDVIYTYEHIGESEKTVKVDFALAEEYLKAAQDIKSKFVLENDITTMSVLKMPDVLTVTAAEENQEILSNLFASATSQAVAALDRARITEGKSVQKDFEKLIANITTALNSVVERAPLVVSDYKEKINKRVAEILNDIPVDESRLATEVAVFADRCDINEEISRLSSHIEQFNVIIHSDEPVGRKLDFIGQEMNREMNTMGSKANDLTLTKLVIEMKNELEKIKEQIRNVE